MAKPKLYAMQDGKDFYCYRKTESGYSYSQDWSAPMRVPDGDMIAAEAARQLFVNQATFAGWEIEWLSLDQEI